VRIQEEGGALGPVVEEVVVADDDLDPQLPRPAQLLVGGAAGVHGHQHRHPGLPRVLHQARGHPVAVAHPVGHERFHHGAELAQAVGEEGGAADAVGIVVAVDHDPLPRIDGAGQTRRGRFDLRQEGRVVQDQGVAVQPLRGRVRGRDPAADQDLGRGVGKGELHAQPFDRVGIRGGHQVPVAVGGRVHAPPGGRS